MICTYRKRGFNGFRFCGKVAVWKGSIKVPGQPTEVTLCNECAALLLGSDVVLKALGKGGS